jgi:hypothetical protein
MPKLMILAFLCINYKYIYKIEKKDAKTIVLAFLYVKLQKKAKTIVPAFLYV